MIVSICLDMSSGHADRPTNFSKEIVLLFSIATSANPNLKVKGAGAKFD